MTATRTDSPGLGEDVWSLFLRQRILKDQLRRLQNDLKHCYCPPGCRGEPQSHAAVDPNDLPAQPLHAPHVPVDSDLPGTWYRPYGLRGPNSAVLAEARGTSDILLYRAGSRATLRMSMQVCSDPSLTGRVGYYGEMFLTQHGREEVYIGHIQSYYMDQRRSPGQHSWDEILLDSQHDDFELENYTENDLPGQRTYFRRLFGRFADAERDHNGNLLPSQAYRDHFAAAWARLSGGTDILYIPFIWIDENLTGQRIIDQGFELFFRLMTSGSLPEPYNVTRPFGAFLEAGELHDDFLGVWRINGRKLSYWERLRTIARAYERNGFMLLDPWNRYDFKMGRRVDPAEYTAAPGDTAILPPNPAQTNLETPSPVRSRRQKRVDESDWPPKRGRREDGEYGDDGDDDDDDDDGDDDDDEHQPRDPPAPGTGMGRGKPPVTPRGGRGGRTTTPSGPRGPRFGTPGRPTTGGLGLMPTRTLFH